MSNRLLPETIHLHNISDIDIQLSGYVPFKCMPRLEPILDHREGQAWVKLSFSRLEHRLIVMQGEISARISVGCQRCLASCELEIGQHFTYGLIKHEKQKQVLSEDIDPLVIEGEVVQLLPLIEDELILAMPMYPSHENFNCNKDLQMTRQQTEKTEEQAELTKKPFAQLAQLTMKSKPK